MVRKLLTLAVLLLALGVPAMATTVTGLVEDANGNLYSYGRYTITYQAGATLQPAATFLTLTGVLDSGGNFPSLTLYDNSTSGSTYLFYICAQNGQPCFSTAITITGASQSVTTTLQTAAASLTNTNPRTLLTLTNQVAPVATPVTGTIALYGKTSDKNLYYKNADGTEVGPLSSTTGATPTFSAITTGTNAVALHVGTGGTLDATGTGTIAATSVNGTTVIGTAFTSTTDLSTTNCAAVGSAANPSVAACGAASAGMFSCATNASTTTCQVNTTAVTANSEILITQDAADGGASQLNVTCNTTLVLPAAKPILLSKSAGVSFTLNMGTITANPACFEYKIVN